MNLSKRRGLFHGAAVLAAAGIVVKVLGACYKIPLGVILGPVGMTNFSIAYNIYSLLFVIATAGVPIAVSKMVAESAARGERKSAQKIFFISKRFFLVFGALGFVTMFLAAEGLSGAMGSSDSAAAIRAISPSVLFVALVAVSRGYFQGHSDMYPTAVSEVIEALGKVVFGLLAAIFLKRLGYSSGMVSAGAVLGVSVGSLFSVIYFKIRTRDIKCIGISSVELREVMKKLLALSVPITIGAAVVSLTAVIDSALVLNILQRGGEDEYHAKWLFGAYTYASTLFSLPSFFISTIASVLVPSLSRAAKHRRVKEASLLSNSALRLSVLISSVIAFGMAALSDGIVSILFSYGADSGCLALSARLLRIMCIGIIPLSVVTVTNAILQALGHANLPVVAIASGGAAKLILNYLLIKSPGIGINGAAISTVVCYVLTALINTINIKKYSYIGVETAKVFLKPLVVGIAFFLTASYTYFKTKPVFKVQFSAIFAAFAGGIVALIGILVLKIVEKDDGKLIFGDADIFKFIDND